MSSVNRAEARKRLIAAAREQLPEPGDPRALIDELTGNDPLTDEHLEVLTRVTLAHRQLLNLKLEASVQGGMGWFLGRNLILFGILGLAARLSSPLTTQGLEAALGGAIAYFLLCSLLAPLRLRKQKAKRAGIVANYNADLSAYLDELSAR
ncbi:MAG: hypothetical protein DHS20C15_22510 [Planctomycetota bacterium]|nr:MAG: hypothetical protein DHS20C15_22510 [Planctomycetota bacterium]